MNKFEIDPNKKTIKIVEQIRFDDFVANIECIIPDIEDYTIIPSANDINNRFNYSNSTLGAPFDENFD